MAHLKDELVLVTGGSGFLAAHCILALLKAGYKVRTTVRTANREKTVTDMLKVGEAPNLDRLSFAHTDLLKDDGWKAAAEGCTYVLHVASPFPSGPPKHEDDLIVPAREGTLRVLRAARDAGAKRVVLTSSAAAVGHGSQGSEGKVFNEDDWIDASSPGLAAYTKSKTIAEKEAWDFIKKEGGNMEMSVVNPVAILGPVLSSDFATSVLLVQRCLAGDIPGCPQVYFSVVDARDVADLELLAMTHEKAKGERFIAVSPPGMWIRDISNTLRREMPNEAKKSPRFNLPNILVRLVSLFDPAVRLVVPELGKKVDFTSDKAKNLLGWNPRSNTEAVVSCAESLLNLGLVNGAPKKT